MRPAETTTAGGWRVGMVRAMCEAALFSAGVVDIAVLGMGMAVVVDGSVVVDSALSG